MKIGFFGGTFNPVHRGHIENAQQAKEQLKLDKVIFIPDKKPVHKDIEESITAEDRYEMLTRVVAEYEGFEVSRIEIDREEPSYTIITIETLKKEYPQCELYMIIGADSFNEIDTWKDYTQIIESVTVVVLRRKTDPILRDDIYGIITKLEIIDNEYIDISSTGLRKKIKQKERVDGQIPDKALEYIKEKRLYLT